MKPATRPGKVAWIPANQLEKFLTVLRNGRAPSVIDISFMENILDWRKADAHQYSRTVVKGGLMTEEGELTELSRQVADGSITEPELYKRLLGNLYPLILQKREALGELTDPMIVKSLEKGLGERQNEASLQKGLALARHLATKAGLLASQRGRSPARSVGARGSRQS